MVRRLIAWVVTMVVAAGLVAVPGQERAEASTTACEGGLTAGALNDVIRGGSRGPGGMLGMDYARVQTLPDGRVLWMFQDVFLGDVPTLNEAAFAHNVGLIQFGSCFRVLHGGTTSSPRSWIGASRETKLRRWFWPLDGTMGADGQFHQFMVEMTNANGTGAAVGATPGHVWIASIRLSDLKVTRFAPAPDDDDRPLFGFSITNDATWTYLYGHCYRQFTNPGYAGAHDLECGPDVYLARVPRGEVWSTPQYWDGSGWNPARQSAVAVMERGSAANPMQVRFVDGRFVAVTKIDDWFGVRVYVDVATEAAGPWTEVARFEPDLVCDECGTYFAHLLPWRGEDGSLLVAISNNAWSSAYARSHPMVYRPRIMAVRPPEGVLMPPPPPDCAVTSTLREGSVGSSVRCLRRRLRTLGYDVSTTSTRFDAAVAAAVRSFQETAGLGVDGIVGSETGRRLGIRGGRTVTPGPRVGPAGCRVTTTLRSGSRGTQVACLNARLKSLGYGVSSTSSVFGSSTRAAVQAFQRSRGLAADGIVGPATRRALGW